MTTTHSRSFNRMGVRRSRGALSGILLILLGIWGALIPFIGPEFDYAYTPDNSWDFTWGRFWLEILPGAAAALGGLILLMSAHRAALLFGGWIAALGGAWYVVGPGLSNLWHDGGPWAGVPASTSTTGQVVEQIGFFTGLGAAILFLGALALGRMTIVGVRDVARQEPVPAEPIDGRSEDRTEEGRSSGFLGRRRRRTDADDETQTRPVSEDDRADGDSTRRIPTTDQETSGGSTTSTDTSRRV